MQPLHIKLTILFIFIILLFTVTAKLLIADSLEEYQETSELIIQKQRDMQLKIMNNFINQK